MAEPFNDLKYQRNMLRGHLREIQYHASNGSAYQNCKCIQEKHLKDIWFESGETVAITTNKKEAAFYQWLALWSDKRLKHVLSVLDANDDEKELAMWLELAEEARVLAKEIEHETFNILSEKTNSSEHELYQKEEDLEHVLA